VQERLGQIRPAVVLNCAAYTDVDGCESNMERAREVNSAAPGYVAESCKNIGALMVHYSTDFVFDGDQREPYRERDCTHPLSQYGQSKLDGEKAVAESACRHLIIRTSWLYGLHGRNFVESILRTAQRGEQLQVVIDQVGRPTYTVDLADATLRLLDADAEGIVHFANLGQCSWHEFACEIVRLAGLAINVGTLSSAELGRPAQRPAYSVLDVSRFQSLTNSTPRHWKDALSDYLQQRKAGVRAA